MSQYTASIQALYVAYFNRPADPSGLAYWETIVAAAKGNTAAVSAEFAKSPEYKVAYAGLGDDAVINQVYLNLFGRSVDAGGLNFWSPKLTAHLVTIDQIVTEVAKGAQGTDATTYANRTTASIAYTDALNADVNLRLAYSNAAAIASAKTFLNGITTTASLTAAIEPTALAGNLAQMVLDAAPIGLTYALTAAVDTLVGTANSDTFTATIGAGGSLTVFDSIDGGSGRDTLTITDTILGDNIATTQFSGVTLKSIETINFQTLGSVAFDTTPFTSVNALNIQSVGGDTIKAATVASVNIVNAISGLVTVDGGNNINVNNTAGAVSVGATTKAVGNVTVKTTGTGNAVTIVGGKNIVTNSAGDVTISKVTGTVGVTAVTGNISVKGGTDVSIASKANTGTVNVGNPTASIATDATTGKQTNANLADYATGNVTINNSTTSTTGVVTYGTSATNAYTNGGTSISVTGAGVTDIADINVIALSPATGIAAVAGTSKLATVSLTGVSGATTIQSDALVNLALTKVSSTVLATVAGAHALSIVSAANTATVTDATATAITVATSGTAADALTLNATKATAVTVGGSGGAFALGSLAGVGTTAGAAGVAAAISLAVTGSVVANLGDLSTNAKLSGVDASTNTGGVTANLSTANGVSFIGGTGADTITLGATTKAIALGDGNDTVTLTATLGSAGSLDGGTGFDTLAGTSVNMSAQLASSTTAKIVGFDLIKVTDVLANGASFDLSALAGSVAFAAGAGVAAGGTATINNLGAGASVSILGDAGNSGTLALTMKTDTAADVLNVTVNHDFVNTNAGVTNAFTTTVSAASVETLNIVSSGNGSVAAAATPDGVNNTLVINDAALVTLNLSGAQAVTYASTAAQTKLATIDASADTAGATITAALSTAGLTIKGSATAANTLTGSGFVDTIVGGAKADVITGGLGGDTLTGNGGNDTFVINNSDSIITAGKADTITDFVANTYGAGAKGVVTSAGANGVAAASLTGDVIQLTHGNNIGTGFAVTSAITVGVYSNASDATTFLATQSGTEGSAAGAQTVHAALNSTTGDLYVDINGDGVADLYLHLTGVQTLTAAAFIVL
jgi:hypothetical protein